MVQGTQPAEPLPLSLVPLEHQGQVDGQPERLVHAHIYDGCSIPLAIHNTGSALEIVGGQGQARLTWVSPAGRL